MSEAEEPGGGPDRPEGGGADGAEGSDGGGTGCGEESAYDHRRLDRLVHSRIRLAVLSLLAGVEDAEFTFLRDQVNTTDGNLSTHLRKLEEAGYVEMEKSFRDRKPVTRYRMTERGREALSEYVERLGAMVGPDTEGSRSG